MYFPFLLSLDNFLTFSITALTASSLEFSDIPSFVPTKIVNISAFTFYFAASVTTGAKRFISFDTPSVSLVKG